MHVSHLGPGLETAQGARLTYSRQPRPHPAVSNFALWVGLPRFADGRTGGRARLHMSQCGYSAISHWSCSRGVRISLPELTTFRDVCIVLGDGDCGEKVALVACHFVFERGIGVSRLGQWSWSGTRIVCV